jgi:hypothetical protein
MAAAETQASTIDLLNIILGAGGIGFVYAMAKVFTAWREGTWRRNDSAVADLEKWRRDANDEREWEALQHQWWRGWAGRLEYRITSRLGPEALPEKEPYPTRPVSSPLEKKAKE